MDNSDKNTISALLETRGANILFHFRKRVYPNQASLYITIESHPTIGNVKITSIERIIDRKEMLELCEYMLNHIEEIKENPLRESAQYIDYTMLYRVRCLAGEFYKEENYATFAIEFLVNIGSSPDKERIWMGSQTIVDSREIAKFYERVKK